MNYLRFLIFGMFLYASLNALLVYIGITLTWQGQVAGAILLVGLYVGTFIFESIIRGEF